MWWKMGGSKWKGLIVGRRRKKSTDKLEIYLLLSGPLYQGPHGNHEFCKMFYFRAWPFILFVRSFPINNNCVRLFWSENHKVKLRWLFDKNPLCCFTTNYYSMPALEMSIPKELVGFSESGSAKKCKDPNPLLISTGFLKYPFRHSFQTGIKIQLWTNWIFFSVLTEIFFQF